MEINVCPKGTVRTQFVTILKLVLGSNAKSPNNKFVERGYKRTRLTSEEKTIKLNVSRWINTNITINLPLIQAKFFIS